MKSRHPCLRRGCLLFIRGWSSSIWLIHPRYHSWAVGLLIELLASQVEVEELHINVFRKLILFLATCGLILLLLGLGLLFLYATFEEQYHHIRPLIVIGNFSPLNKIMFNTMLGPVLIGASLFTLMFSIEICIRYL